MKILPLLLIAVSLCACDALEFTVPHHDMPGRMVIFTAQQAEENQSHYMVGKPLDGYWTPAIDEAMTMERALMAQLQDDERMTDVLDELPHGYYRQIAGVTIEGENYVFAAYMCREFEGWREDWIGIDDGGNCFFEALYQPRTGEFSWIYVHGAA